MKKRILALLLSMTFVSLYGCGNNTEPKQEEQQQEEVQQQEETKTDVETEKEEEKQEETESDSVIAENDVLVLKEKTGYGEFDFSVFEEPQALGEEKTFNVDTPVYNEEGIEVGYIKSGSTIKIDQVLNLVWCCFTNPINDTEYDKLYVKQEYFSDDGSQEEVKQEVATNTQDEILEKVGYDKDKTYEEDEYIEILTSIFKEMGKEYNSDVEKDFIDYNKNKTTFEGYHVMMTYIVCDFSDNEKILQDTKSAMSYMEGGLDGMSNITEFAIGKGQNNGEETINIYVKVSH